MLTLPGLCSHHPSRLPPLLFLSILCLRLPCSSTIPVINHLFTLLRKITLASATTQKYLKKSLFSLLLKVSARYQSIAINQSYNNVQPSQNDAFYISHCSLKRFCSFFLSGNEYYPASLACESLIRNFWCDGCCRHDRPWRQRQRR